MTGSIGCAVVQFSPTLDREQNLARLREFVALAAERGARIVVAPEYASAFTANLGDWMHEHAEPLDGRFVRGVGEIATEFGVTIIASLLELGSPKPFNTVFAVGENGALLASYRKVHLYDAFGAGESEWLAAGDPAADPVVVEAAGLRIGLQTCYDLRFPEVSRRLIDAGADVLAVPAEWVRGPLKEFHWNALLQARAIENTVYVVAADQPAPVAVGRSVIVDPRGIEVAGLGSEEGVAVAWLEAETLASVRTQNPALQLRRYGDARVIPRAD